jgi:hypothetical protein
MIIGFVVAAVAVVIVLIQGNSGTTQKAASSPPPASESAPVVTAKTSGAVSYLSDLHPSGGLGELVNSGPVNISGSVYPKSITFYCNVGDATAFPTYTLQRKSRRFQATVGLPPKSSTQFRAAVMLYGDGRTLRTFVVGVRKPKTVDVNVTGVHTLRLECFGSGNSYTGGEAIAAVWGNALISRGH